MSKPIASEKPQPWGLLLRLVSTPGGGARLSKESLAPAPPARPVSPGVLTAPSPPPGSRSNSSSSPVPDTREAAGSLPPPSRGGGDLNNPDIFQF